MIEKVWQWVDIKKRRIKEKVTILLCIGNNNDSNDPQIRNIVYWIDIRIRLIINNMIFKLEDWKKLFHVKILYLPTRLKKTLAYF